MPMVSRTSRDARSRDISGMACSDLVFGENGEVIGVIAGEFGLDKEGNKTEGYEPGMEVLGKYVLLGEGVRGSLTKTLIQKYKLDAKSQPQKYGLGMKEIWEIDPKFHKEEKFFTLWDGH